MKNKKSKNNKSKKNQKDSEEEISNSNSENNSSNNDSENDAEDINIKLIKGNYFIFAKTNKKKLISVPNHQSKPVYN